MASLPSVCISSPDSPDYTVSRIWDAFVPHISSGAQLARVENGVQPLTYNFLTVLLNFFELKATIARPVLSGECCV